MKTYYWYSDPAHGWLKVQKKEIARLGIAQKVSSYSYQRGEYAYLEEDGDASAFIDALQTHGKSYKLKEGGYSNNSSKIRNYEAYTA